MGLFAPRGLNRVCTWVPMCLRSSESMRNSTPPLANRTTGASTSGNVTLLTTSDGLNVHPSRLYTANFSLMLPAAQQSTQRAANIPVPYVWHAEVAPPRTISGLYPRQHTLRTGSQSQSQHHGQHSHGSPRKNTPGVDVHAPIWGWNRWQRVSNPIKIKPNFGYVLSQWESVLPCNASSHWLGPWPEWSLKSLLKILIWVNWPKNLRFGGNVRWVIQTGF